MEDLLCLSAADLGAYLAVDWPNVAGLLNHFGRAYPSCWRRTLRTLEIGMLDPLDFGWVRVGNRFLQGAGLVVYPTHALITALPRRSGAMLAF